MSTQTQHLLDQTRADARTAVAALAAAARTGAAAEAAAEAYAAALDAAEADPLPTPARRPRRLTAALAAGVVAVTLVGCGGAPAPVTDDAPLCDTRTTELCFDAAAGHYVGARGEHYGPGALVHRGYLGLSTYVVPTR